MQLCCLQKNVKVTGQIFEELPLYLIDTVLTPRVTRYDCNGQVFAWFSVVHRYDLIDAAPVALVVQVMYFRLQWIGVDAESRTLQPSIASPRHMLPFPGRHGTLLNHHARKSRHFK